MSPAVDDPNASRLFDAVVDPILISDYSGAAVLGNALAGALFDYSTAQMLELTVGDPVPKWLRTSHPQHREANPHRARSHVMGAVQLFPGLDSETAKSTFDPFVATKPHGIGKSLAVSRTLARAQGGQIWFDSPSEVGTCLHITLPLVS